MTFCVDIPMDTQKAVIKQLCKAIYKANNGADQDGEYWSTVVSENYSGESWISLGDWKTLHGL